MALDAKKVMTREAVAKLFGKSERWVCEQIIRGGLVPHYAGETPLFYEDEVVSAWLEGKLDRNRKANDSKAKKKNRGSVGSTSQAWGPQVLQDV